MFRTSITRTAAAVIAVGTLGFAAPAASAGDLANKPPINGNSGNNVLYGTSGPDSIYGFWGSDLLFGRAGDDRIYGGKDYDDVIFPGPGKDTAYAESGIDREQIHDDDADTDKLSGGDGPDRIHAANGVKDYVDCGADDDRAVVDAQDSVKGCETVVKTAGDVLPWGHYPVNFRFGTSGQDYLTVVGIPEGSDGDDYLSGKGGDDVLNSYAGSDRLYGGDGKDFVYGGDGYDHLYDDDNDRDMLFGGAGPDTIYAANGFADTVDCGESTHPEGFFDQPVDDQDVAFVDGIDTVIDCELVNSNDPHYALAGI